MEPLEAAGRLLGGGRKRVPKSGMDAFGKAAGGGDQDVLQGVGVRARAGCGSQRLQGCGHLFTCGGRGARLVEPRCRMDAIATPLEGW